MSLGWVHRGTNQAEIEYALSYDPRQLRWIPEAAIGRDFDDVPGHIASPASEAYEVLSIGAYRAAAALARAVVEAVGKDQGHTMQGIYPKIEAMREDRLLRPHIADAAHEVRHLGNDMAHGDFVDPVTQEEAAEVLGLMAEILDEVYASPARVRRRTEAREAKAQRERQDAGG